MLTYLQRLTDERDSLTATATAITEAAATEGRDVTATETSSLTAMAERCAAIDGQLTTFGGQLDAQRAYATLRSHLGERIEERAEESSRPSRSTLGRTPAGGLGWGRTVVDSPQFRGYAGRGSMAEVELPNPLGIEERAPILTGDWPGYVPPYQFSPTPWKMTTPLLDVLGKVSTSANVVEWFTWPNSFPLAPVVPEGGVKPEANFAPTPHTESLETYAHYKPLSRQALSDIPQIRSIVEGALKGGLYAALEQGAAGVLAADTSMAGIPTPADVDGGMLAGIRMGIGTVQAAGYAQPNAVLLNPADFAELDMSVMAATVNGPVRNGSVWGIRAIAVGAIPVGTAYVGDLATAVTLFSRSTAAVYLTDSHADYFVKNLLVILAELRALVAITEPQAVVRISATGATGESAPASAPASVRK